ncbi:hypothetical protein N2152v2_007835 [Parachlorella kessleri]
MVWLESLNKLAYRNSSKAAPAEPAYNVSSDALATGSSLTWVELAATTFLLLITMAVARVRDPAMKGLGGSATLSVDMRFEYQPCEASEEPVKAKLSMSSTKVLRGSRTASDPAPPSLSTLSLLAPVPPPVEQQPSGHKFAYVTLLTRDSYLLGAQCLARSLRAAGSRFPLVVLYTPDTLSSSACGILRQEGCQLLPVERYHPAGPQDFGRYKLQHYAECWTKLRMLVYLDADTVVTRNIDALFALPQGFYAAGDCAYGRPTQQERDACAMFSKGRPPYFNAGFYVMSPSKADFQRFSELLASGAVKIGGYAEQDFLNEYYKDSWRALPFTFNAQKVMKLHHPELWSLSEVNIIHYVDHKPWDRECPAHAPYQDLVDLWWGIFEGRHQPGPPAMPTFHSC